MAKNYILDEGTAARKLQRMAYEILENNLDELLTHFHAAIVTLKVSTPMKKVKSVVLELSHDKYYPEFKLIKSENPSTTQQKFFNEWMKSAVSRTYSFMN